MSASVAAAILRRARPVFVALSLSTLAFAQTNLGFNPSVNSGSLTLNALDTFTGTLSVGGSGTLLLGSDYTTTLPLVFTSNGTYLSYSGGTVRTLTLASSASLTRSGAAGYTYVYDNLANSGAVTLSGGTLQFQSGTTLINSLGATTSVTGSGSTLYLVGLANSGTFNVASSGLVQLAGAFTTANLGSFTTASGGAVQLSGTLNNTGATLTLPAGTALTLFGGTITGGNITSASLALSNSGGTLDGATVNGNLAVGTSQAVTLQNPNAGATGTTTVNTGTVNLGTDLTANAGSAFVFAGNGSYLSYTGGTVRTLTLPAGTSLTRSGAAGYTYVYDNLTNAGTVTISGGTLQFQSGTTFTNSGTTTVSSAGSDLYLVGLANSGTLGVDTNGVIQLAGAFTTPNLGSFTTASGGAVQLSGTLNNTGSTLSLPGGSALTLFGGTITGGNITSTSLALSSSGGTLDGATVNGNLSVGTNQSVTLQNANAGATGTTTVTTGTVNLGTDLTANPGSAFVFAGNGSYLSYTGGKVRTLTLPAGTSLTRSGGAGYTYVYDNLTNAGTVTISGGTLQFQSGTTFTNSGTATVSGAGSNLYLVGLANSGTLGADTNGVIQLAGAFTTPNLGSFTTASGGAVQLSGTLNNTGATLTLPAGTALTLFGGTITGGNITSASLALSNSGGTLDGATVNGNLAVGTSQAVTLQNPNAGATGTTTVNTGTVNLGTDLTANPGSAFVFAGNGSYLSYTGGTVRTLTLPAGTSLTRSGAAGYTYAYDNLTNAGTVTISGGTLQFQSGTTFTNSGTATVTGAGSNLYLIGLTNTGTLIADSGGVLQLAGNFTTAGLGTFAITGATPGSVQITGTLDNTGATLTAPTGGVYTLNGGTIKNGTIIDTAFTQLSGTLDGATVLGNLTIASAQSLNWKNAGAGATGLTTVNGQLFIDSSLPTLNGSTLALTGSSSTLNYHNTQPTLTVIANSTLSRSGAGSTNVYPNLANAGNIVVNGGTLFLNANVTNSGALTVSNTGTFSQNSPSYSFTNTGTANVTGAGSTLIVSGLINTGGNLISDSGGLLQLAGNFATGNLGTISATGSTAGSIEITGTLDNTGANLGVPTGGIYTLNGGTIKNGTITDTAFTQKSGTLDGATVLGNLTIASAQSLNWKNAGAGATGLTTVNGQLFIDSTLSTLNGSTLSLAGSSSTLNYHNTQPTLTVVANSTLSRTGAGSTNVYPNLANAGNIVVSGGTLFMNANVTNSGALTVSNAGTFSQNSPSYSFTNTGTANVTGAGSTLIVSGLINTGGNLISDSSGLLQLAGNFTTGNLGNIALTGATHGTVEITGILDNTGANLAGGPFILNGGTIKNGTITDTAFTQKSGTLDGATVLGNLSIASAQTLNWKNAGAGATGLTTVNGQLFIDSTLSTLNGSTLSLTGSSSTLNYHNAQPTLTVVANSTLSRSGSGSTNIYPNLANAGNIVVSGGTLFLNANVTNSGTLTVSNAGTFSQNSPSYSFTNTGTANVTGITSTLVVSDLINTGAITSDSGGLLQLAGNFTTGNLGSIAATGATPGTIQITGLLDNTGTTLTAPISGIYTLNGGTIKGGNIPGTAFTQLSGTLDGATVNGNLSIASGQTLNWKNAGAGATGLTTVNGQLFIDSTLSTLNGSTLALTGSSSTLNYHNAQPTLTIVANSTLSRSGAGSTTVFPILANAGNVVVNGGSLFVQAGFTNASNITVAAGSTLSNASGLTQTAGTLQVDGTFNASAPGLNISGGSLTGAGNLSGNTTFTGGTLDPGSAIGTLTFVGNLTLTGGATTLIQLGAGTNINDKVVVSGASNTLVFGGALDIVTSATTFASGQTWNVFSFTNHSGSFASLTLPNTSSGWVWDTSQLTTTGVLTLTTFVPVPEPSTYALVASGLGLIFAFRRRAASRVAPRNRNSL